MALSNQLIKIADILETLNCRIGRGASYLAIAMAVGVTLLVILRNGFDWGNIAAQELILYFHSALFLLCLSYTAHCEGHVRVDIHYRRLSKTAQAWIDILGNIIFLLPFASFLLLVSWPYAEQSWRLLEGSSSSNGLDFVFLLKSLIPLAALLLLIYALSDTLKKLALILIENESNVLKNNEAGS